LIAIHVTLGTNFDYTELEAVCVCACIMSAECQQCTCDSVKYKEIFIGSMQYFSQLDIIQNVMHEP